MRDDELDERLRSFDRMRGVRVPGEVLDRTVAEVRAGRQRLRAGVIAGAAVLGIGGLLAAPVAANALREWLAVAEWQPEAGGEILPDSEMIDLSAPDLPEYIASRFPDDLPIPPGATREELIAAVVEHWQSVPETGFTQEIGFRYEFERLAYCGWLDARLTSVDIAVLARADAVLEEAIRWPAFVTTDADGVVPIFLRAYAEASHRGDLDGLQYAAWQYGCPVWDGDPRAWWGEQNIVRP
jgi:hypothetical protein